jgi:hypothetical protein
MKSVYFSAFILHISGSNRRIPKNTNKSHKSYAKKIIFINIDSRKIKFILLDLSH